MWERRFASWLEDGIRRDDWASVGWCAAPGRQRELRGFTVAILTRLINGPLALPSSRHVNVGSRQLGLSIAVVVIVMHNRPSDAVSLFPPQSHDPMADAILWFDERQVGVKVGCVEAASPTPSLVHVERGSGRMEDLRRRRIV